ncbi:MAG: glutaredoxin family protein [Burkholderiaceae bacterium]|nr:MAG: glutaredoxin family protein [Burkholderiaceae bacterium]
MRLTPWRPLAGDLATGLHSARTREPANPRTRELRRSGDPDPQPRKPPMKKLILLALAAAIAGHWAWKHHRGSEAAEMAREADITWLAQDVKPGQVVMYTTTDCTYCHQAKDWLADKGFAFTECNMSVDRRCEDEFRAYKANGTPFLVIRRGGRTHEMHEGFDSEEFLAALRG